MRIVTISLLVLATVVFQAPVEATDDKALKAERRAAQKDRQEQKRERTQLNREILQDFREFTKELKADYRERARDLDVSFRLQKEELNASRRIKISAVEAEMQQNIMQLFLNQNSNEQMSLEKLKTNMQAYSDKVFAIKQQSADEEHEEFIQNEQQKHKLFTEQDQLAIKKARELGLLDKPKPILASAIGGELTKQEQRWNDREKKDTERMFESNQRYVKEFNYGKELREWEIANKREDHRLKQEKNKKLHTLNTEQTWINNMMFSPQTNEEREDFAAKIAELRQKTQEINIEYDKNKRKKSIERKEQLRKITKR